MPFKTDYRKQEELYENYLAVINGIKFTFREIDLIACIINNRGEKKIASLLSVSPRTVSAHVYNIMGKLNCNSKDQIIDFIERSGKLLHLRQYYLHLLIKAEFEKSLTRIGRQLNRNSTSCSYDRNVILNLDKLFFQSIEKHLNLANIILVEANDRNKDMSAIDFRKISGENYYHDMLVYLQELITNPETVGVAKEFEESCKAVQNMYEGNTRALDSKNSKSAFLIKLFRSKKYVKYGLVFSVLTIFILAILVANVRNKAISYSEQNNRPAQTDKSQTIEQLEKFLETIKGGDFSANNFTKEQIHKNHSIVKQVEQLLEPSNSELIQAYFNKAEIPADKLLSYLYALHALASYYNVHEYAGAKARELLICAKKLTEDYIKSRSTIAVEFDKLKVEEVLAELGIIKDLPEMYTRIIFVLGRTYMYQGDNEEGVKYFELAKYLGTRLGLFEGRSADRSGLGVINKNRASAEIQKGNMEAAIKILKNLLGLYKSLQLDDKAYIINFTPGISKQQTIVPKEDIFNITECSARIIEIYTNLIRISADKSLKESYLPEIKGQINGSKEFQGVLNLVDSLSAKRGALIYNDIANLLLELHKSRINFDRLSQFIQDKLSIRVDDNLELIKYMFNLARSKSRNTDYTKADAYDGLVRVYTEELQNKNIALEQKKILEAEIRELIEKRDLINKGLDRQGNN